MKMISKRLNLKVFTFIFIGLFTNYACFAVDYSGTYTQFKSAITDTSAMRNFTATGDMTATSNTGTMGGTNSYLFLDGAGYTLNGINGATQYYGVTATGQTITINNFGSLNPDGSILKSINNFKRTGNGAFFSASSSSVSVENSIFKSNTVTNIGGALYAYNGSTLLVQNSVFDSNSAIYGGAIYKSSTGITTITGTKFINNAASGYGAALVNLGSTFIINSSNFIGNSSVGLTNSGTYEIDTTLTNRSGAIYSDFGKSITGSVSDNSVYESIIGGVGVGNLFSGNSVFASNSTTTTNFNSTANGYGGAIQNTSTMTTSSVLTNIASLSNTINVNSNTFENNTNNALNNGITKDGSSYAYSYGGAIVNSASATASGTGKNTSEIIVNIQNNNIINNFATSENSGSLSVTKNVAKAAFVYTYGGAVRNVTTATSSNTGENLSKTITNITGNVIDNNSAKTLNSGNSTGLSAAYLASKNSYAYGGGIVNDMIISAHGAGVKTATNIFNVTDNLSISGNEVNMVTSGTATLGSLSLYGYGGGISNTVSSSCSVDGTAFSEVNISNNNAINLNKVTILNSANNTAGDNSSIGSGGAIYNTLTFVSNDVDDSTHLMTIDNNNFDGNSVFVTSSGSATGLRTTYASGGAIGNINGTSTNFQNSAIMATIISNNEFKNNSAESTTSGNTTATGNTHAYGGAVYNANYATNSGALANSTTNTTDISGNIFDNNLAKATTSGNTTGGNSITYSYGGAIYASNYSTNTNVCTGTNSSTNTTNILGNSFTNNKAEVSSNGTVTSGSKRYESYGGAVFANQSNSNAGTGTNSSINKINIQDNEFKSNEASLGGAVFVQTSSTNTSTGVNSGVSEVKISKNLFENNNATTRGGAICTTQTVSNTNVNGQNTSINNIDIENNRFLSNTAPSGGAICNTAGILNTSNNYYEANSAETGGVILNHASVSTSNILITTNMSNEIFKLNKSELISDTASTTAYGGVAYNRSSSTTGNSSSIINFSNSLFEKNYSNASSISSNASSYGGVVYNIATSSAGTAKATGDIQNSNFVQNYSNATSTNSYANSYGGVFYNGVSGVVESNIVLKNTLFDSNIVSSSAKGTASATHSYAKGGVIYNTGTNAKTTILNSSFLSNKASATGTSSLDYTEGFGGAIFNDGTITIQNSIFNNNEASTKGGAIYNYTNGVLNIIADNGVTSFSGNKAANVSNAIYLDTNSNLNLNAGNNGTIIFNDKISSAINTNTININKPGIIEFDGVTTAPTDGLVTFNDTVSNSIVNFYGGTLSLGSENLLDANAVMLGGGNLNLLNNSTGTMNLSSLNLADGTTTNLSIDANLTNNSADKIVSATPVSGTGSLNVNNINVFGASTANNIDLLIADDNVKNNVTMTPTSVMTDIYKYNLSYNNNSGQLSFSSVGSGGSYTGFNPKILTSTINNQTGNYLTQANIYSEALGRMDALTSISKLDRLIMRYQNKVASADENFVFSPTFLAENSKGLWFKQYATFENVPLQNGPNVSNVSYGMLVGGDTDIKSLGHGFDGYYTFYSGYNGSHQNYANTGVYQNGGILGATGTVYKGNFFGSLTLNVGANNGTSSTNDNFTSIVGGVAAKTGYNFEFLDGKLIFQPSLMMAYTYANTFNYTTTSGVNIDSSPLNAIQIVPGIKFIGNLKNGWQPYIAVNMVSNITMGGYVYANDIQLPNMTIAPYVEYGFGIQRKFGERLSGFAQTMLRGGGRNGITLQWGLRWAI